MADQEFEVVVRIQGKADHVFRVHARGYLHAMDLGVKESKRRGGTFLDCFVNKVEQDESKKATA